jgi:hypothetical protein
LCTLPAGTTYFHIKNACFLIDVISVVGLSNQFHLPDPAENLPTLWRKGEKGAFKRLELKPGCRFPQNKNLKNILFLDTIYLNALRDLPICRNQPRKWAED